MFVNFVMTDDFAEFHSQTFKILTILWMIKNSNQKQSQVLYFQVIVEFG